MRLRDTAPVTVVIPCFRCTRTIKRAITSIEHQTQKPAEVILVDDASGDDTMRALKEIEQQYRGWIQVVSLKENLGAAGARNVAWAMATQPFIAFLDADDAWHPQKIEIQYAYMSSHTEVVLCGHSHRVLKHVDARHDWALGDWLAMPICKWQLLLSNTIITPSVMLRRSIHQRFTSGQRHMEDHMLWLEVVCNGGKINKLSAELAAIHKSPFGEGGLSGQMWLMEKADLNNYKKCLQNNYISHGQWSILSIYSLVKFLRRLVIHWCYLRWIKWL